MSNSSLTLLESYFADRKHKGKTWTIEDSAKVMKIDSKITSERYKVNYPKENLIVNIRL